MREICGLLVLIITLAPIVTVADSEKVKVINKVRTKIVNGSKQAIPVKGQVTLKDPVEIEGTVDVNVVSNPAVTTRPVQFPIAAAFQDGQTQAGPPPGNFPTQEVSVPDNSTLVIEYVGCRAQVNEGQKLDIAFLIGMDRAGTPVARRPYTAPLQTLLTRDVFGSRRDTLVSNERVNICLGAACETLSNNTSWQSRIRMEGQRDSDDGFTRVDCVVNGILISS